MIDKREAFSKEDQQVANFAKALSHPARLSILRYLSEQNSCICGDIVEVLPLAQSTVSQHLKELKQVGLIQGYIEVNSSCYCIAPDQFELLKKILSAFTHEIEISNLMNCC